MTDDSGREGSGASAGARGWDLTILMPVYNEVATIETAISRVLDADLGQVATELVVIDDGSTDGTSDLLGRGAWGDAVRVIRHSENQGKGAALQTGCLEARGQYTAILDADLEYEVEDIAELLKPLRRGDAEVVFGKRGFESHSAYSFWYVLGNKAVTLAANVLFNSWVSDIMTCHKVMPTRLLRSLDLREKGFGIEPEITARLLRSNVRIYEVAVSYRARDRAAGKKLTAVDGLRVLRTLIRCRLT